MPRADGAIRVRVADRVGMGENWNPREAFWASLRKSELFSDLRIEQYEAKLCREFGGELRSKLLEQLSAGLRAIDSDLFPGSLRDFESLIFRYVEPFPQKDAYRYQFAEAFTRYLEHRHQILRENAALRAAQERIVAAASVLFSTRISGYGSLSFDISTGSFEQLAKAFDSNFETFRIFLDAFIPTAFAEVFTEEFSDHFDFTVTIPPSVEMAFAEATRELGAVQATGSCIAGGPQIGPASPSSARERAEWYWRLANGSLLIPLLISLAVMFFGIRLLGEIYDRQFNAIQPILDHQLELLKEDRIRMAAPLAIDQSKPKGSTAHSPTAEDHQ